MDENKPKKYCVMAGREGDERTKLSINFHPLPCRPPPPLPCLTHQGGLQTLGRQLARGFERQSHDGGEEQAKGQHTLPRVSPNTELRRASSSSCDLYAMAAWSISLRGQLYFPRFHPSTDFLIPSQPLKALRIYLSIIFYPQSISIIKENGVIGILR